ncbi:MAG: flagellar biosynthesis protein FlhF, partial [Fimbriimonadales bacterium]
KLPLHVATSADEVKEGLELFRGYDLVLIDTIGRGQRDESHLQEMYHALMPAQPMVYLVLSATSDIAVMEEAVQKFGIFAPEAMILTKTDEAVRFGNCINLCVRNPIPMAYFTTGQRVPEDICNADAQWLTSQVMRAITECQVSRERQEVISN